MPHHHARQLIAIITICLSTHASFAAERSDADAKRDQHSKPLEVLEFLGVGPGWTVVDLFAGNGYYSEVLSGIVGASGKVYLHNNQSYLGFVQGLDERLQDNRLPNVESYIREIEDIDLKSNSVDLVMLVMAYHDAYFVNDGWTVTADPLFRSIHRVLRSGGVLAVIDHQAVAGSGNAAVQTLHRIEPDFAKADIESRGFQFEAASEMLVNDSDDLSMTVFDPTVQGKTSKFLFKFVKP